VRDGEGGWRWHSSGYGRHANTFASGRVSHRAGASGGVGWDVRGDDGLCWWDEGFTSKDGVADCYRAEMGKRLVCWLMIERKHL
jgi:hypothetical protein